MQSESLLSYQRGLQGGGTAPNCQSLFGMQAIPTDDYIRAMQDPVGLSRLQFAFDGALDALRRHGGLAAFQRLGGRVLIALDGTEYFCSQKLGCPQCLTRHRTNGPVESYHSMPGEPFGSTLAATLVAPGHAMALPLMPEFTAPQGGAEKQGCKHRAAKRWLSNHGGRLKGLRLTPSATTCSSASRSPKPSERRVATSCSPSSRRRTRHPATSWMVPPPRSTQSSGSSAASARPAACAGSPRRHCAAAGTRCWSTRPASPSPTLAARRPMTAPS